MRRSLQLILIFSLIFSTFSRAQVDLGYYLPEGVQYDEAIPTPKDFLGYEIGEWHITHDQLVYYMQELARVSDRVTIEEYARSHEARPLILLTITSAENHGKIDEIQKNHVALADASQSGNADIESMPAVVYAGYTVHGNEPSTANATPLLAYHLAAGQGKEIENLLSNVVILLDPMYNPDGYNRFASWVNTHKSKNLNPDPATREHNEAWPRGRTNHYWFDLNRDWLLVQHPESQGRVDNFQQWKPNIVLDYHEMGTNSTYFFQPGIPTRTNPLTPKINQELTYKIAEFHAKALDGVGSLYYTQESFDDFYYGKGSTYPDVQGCIGILFEQGSSRGHLQSSINGDVSFPFTIKNQLLTSLSSLEAAEALRTDLLAYKRDFYQQVIKEAQQDKAKGVIFGDAHDPARVNHFLKMVMRHDIKVHEVVKSMQAGGNTFEAGTSYIIPFEQPQYRLIKSMFEQRTSFEDSLFYDVSAWTLPLAFNLHFSEIGSLANASKAPIGKPNKVSGAVEGNDNAYAYLMDWSQYHAPSVLHQLLKKEVIVKTAAKEFSAVIGNETVDFGYGTIMIAATQQSISEADLKSLLTSLSNKYGVTIMGTNTGFTAAGMDLGSRNFGVLRDPKALLLVGDGVSSYDAGEVWHLLDHRFDIDLTIVDVRQFGNIDLNDYNTLVLVNGGYNSIGSSGKESVKEWISNGGTVVAMRGAIQWLKGLGVAGVEFKSDRKELSNRPYGSLANDSGAEFIGGAIFETELDLSHPLAYGYRDSQLPVFRRGTMFMQPTNNAYATPHKYTSDPLMAGYISDHNEELVKNAAASIVCRHGGGKVICLGDNPNFRGYWYGTTKLFLNAIYFGHTISGSAAERYTGNKTPSSNDD
ncbi:MAG: M14 metallopeptidase family protein [Bacteroidota bacterium]